MYYDFPSMRYVLIIYSNILSFERERKQVEVLYITNKHSVILKLLNVIDEMYICHFACTCKIKHVYLIIKMCLLSEFSIIRAQMSHVLILYMKLSLFGIFFGANSHLI